MKAAEQSPSTELDAGSTSKNHEAEAPKKQPPPPPPEKPLPDDCCGSGCIRCVWDIYYDELEAYNKLYGVDGSESESKRSWHCDTLIDRLIQKFLYFSGTPAFIFCCIRASILAFLIDVGSAWWSWDRTACPAAENIDVGTLSWLFISFCVPEEL